MVLVWAVASLAALVWALAAMSIDRSPVAEAGSANLRNLWPFWIASGSGWAALGALWLWLHRTAAGSNTTRFARVSWLIVSVAGAARVMVLLTHQPALSDDIYRYVFDGRNLAHGMNPYLVTPAQRVGLGENTRIERPLSEIAATGALVGGERWPGEARLIERINNPELYTIYLPASQWVFAAGGLIIGDRWTDPATGVGVFRAVFILADLATILLVLAALRRAGRSPWWAALYAWHPLPIAELAGSGHQEGLAMVLLMAALVLHGPAPKKIWRWTAALALGALVKPVLLPVAAVLLKGRSWGAWARCLLFGSVVTVVVAAPLLVWPDLRPFENLSSTAQRFTLKWAHFGSVYEPLLTVIEGGASTWSNDGQERLARTICGALLIAAMVGVWMTQRDAWRAGVWIFLAMVLLSPAAHPWYVLWALVLLPMAPSPAVWIASLTLPWGYAVLADTQTWSVSPWVMVAAYVPVYGALVVEVKKGRGMRPETEGTGDEGRDRRRTEKIRDER